MQRLQFGSLGQGTVNFDGVNENESVGGGARQHNISAPEPPVVHQVSGRRRLSRGLARIGQSAKSALVAGITAALLVGSAGIANAQTDVTRPVPLKPVAVTAHTGANADKLAIPRTGNDLAAHLQRASLINPFLASFQAPDANNPLSPEVQTFLWRLVSRSMLTAENAADHTNMIPTTPVAGEMVWRAKVKNAAGKEIDVLPMMVPQILKADGTIDMDKALKLFSRMNNLAPAAGANDVYLAANVGFKNGRAAYFPLDAINPEPLQPMVGSGTPALPQFTVLLPNGQKLVHTVGALCVKGNGPSFNPQNSGYWNGGGSTDSWRKVTPLNEEVRAPIHVKDSDFGLFKYEPDAKTNEYGWKTRDIGAYNGVSIAHIKINEIVDYRLDKDGRPIGNPVAIPLKEMHDSGRISASYQPSLIWRAFATEYRLSAYRAPGAEGVKIMDHVRAIFARDALFTYIANSPALDTVWQHALEAAANGDAQQMEIAWKVAITGLNNAIAGGKSYLKQPITVDANGVASVSKEDFIRTMVHRGARNVVVLNELKLNHNSIAAGGDNINAAFEIVDNDDLNPNGATAKTDPKKHTNINEMTSNLDDVLEALSDRVPELKQFKGKIRDMIIERIDEESKIFVPPARGNG